MRKRSALALLLALVGCGLWPTDTCACLPAASRVIVFGTITTAADGAAMGAEVVVTAWPPSCDLAELTSTLTNTNADGAFRAEILLGASADTVCVRVRARGAGAPVDDAVTSAGTLVQFASFPDLPDSVRVDLQLQ